MLNKQIFFTAVRKAELLENEIRKINEDEVLVKMEYTVISGGTERACILGMNNTSQKFPMSLGYCGVGYVEEIGQDVNKVCVWVIGFWFIMVATQSIIYDRKLT